MTMHIEIAIAVILVFFTLSLVVTALNEAVAVALNRRGKLLYETLASLVDDDALRQRLFESAPMRAAFRARSGTDAPDARSFPEWLPTADMAETLVGIWREDGPLFPKPNRAGDEKIIYAILRHAGEAVERAETVVATTINQALGQLSVRYKRQQQIMAVVFGFMLAAAFNVNVVTLVSSLAADETLRAAFVAQAEIAIRDGVATTGGDAVDALEQSLGGLADIPGLGWTNAHWTELTGAAWPWSILTVAGWLATWPIAAFAAMLGTPFWFDLLRRVVQSRAAIREKA